MNEQQRKAMELALDLAIMHHSDEGYSSLRARVQFAIKEALAQPEQETQAYRAAAQLAKWLFKTHYAQEEHYSSGRISWGLCDTTAGVISQIDNMVCKLVFPKEPEQEPVAWMYQHPNNHLKTCYQAYKPNGECTPLYTTPYVATPRPQRKPLTDEEILAVARDHYNLYQRPEISFARAIEATHGIKE